MANNKRSCDGKKKQTNETKPKTTTQNQTNKKKTPPAANSDWWLKQWETIMHLIHGIKVRTKIYSKRRQRSLALEEQKHQQSCLCKQKSIKWNSKPKHNQVRGENKITSHLPKANCRHTIVKHFLAIGISISSGRKYNEKKKYNH